jgi:predicted ATPase
MLERIRLTDWKSFVDEQVELAPLTLLVGANASGKSNFLDAIRFHTARRTSPRILMEPESFRAAPFTGSAHQIQFLDIQPRRMRGYGKRGSPLHEDGSNVSGVLADLCDEPSQKQTIVDWLREFCAPEIVELDFIEVRELGDVMAIFVEHGDRRVSARNLSDGTLRFLGILVALRTAQPGSVILIEEIEAALHPTRIRLLVEHLQTVTRERDVQIIATTHSPVVLDWLDEAALASAIVFGRIPDRQGTVMRRLGDLPHFREVAARKGIELVIPEDRQAREA